MEKLDKTYSYLSIDGKVVGLNEFVSDFIKKSIIGVINTLNLDDYDVEKIGKIELLIPDENAFQDPIDADCSILINDKPLEINEFTKNIVSNSIKGMVNSIKTEDNVTTIDVEISDIKDELDNADILIKTNAHDVELNAFTQGILKETIYGIITSLKIDEKINKITIRVKE